MITAPGSADCYGTRDRAGGPKEYQAQAGAQLFDAQPRIVSNSPRKAQSKSTQRVLGRDWFGASRPG